MTTRSRRTLAAAAAAIALAALAACAGSAADATTVRLGWTSEVPALDPAASQSVASFALLSAIYPSLLAVAPDESTPVPEIAASAEWTADGAYQVVLKSGLTFANGHDLTASDVKFSIERQLALQAEDGAWRQLEALQSVDIVDDTTLLFHLTRSPDAGFPYVLAGPAGLILDEETFDADELTGDDEILDAQPFAGPFQVEATRGDDLLLEPFDGYAGPTPAIAPVDLVPGTASDLAQQLHDGSIDALSGRLDADTLARLAADGAVDLTRADSGRARLLAFDLQNMPSGTRTDAPNAGAALAIRQAAADLIDRDAIVHDIGPNLIQPLYGYLPDGVPGSGDPFAQGSGDGDGGPDADRAAQTLAAAGVATPVALTIHVDLDEVGVPGHDEVAAIAGQLDDGGLFDVTVVETDADGLSAARLAGEVQAVFTSVLPSNSDPQEYLTPFRAGGITAPGYADGNVEAILDRQRGELDAATREASLAQAQAAIAANVPAIPITQGVRVVFARPSVSGTELDDGFPLDLTRLTR